MVIAAAAVQQRIHEQIRNLLKRNHKPLVQVGKSNISGAGSGVFSRQCIDSSMLPTVMCLYPGIYTPGMPPYATEYLANLVPPSGPDMQENAYIMNLQSCGGYIDGLALHSQYYTTNHHHHDAKKLDANHSACGHLINHHARNYNTSVYSFSWSEVLKYCSIKEDYFPLPNEIRSDGSPWYYDEIEGRITCFPSKDTDDPSQPPPLSNQLCGAALILTSPVSKGDELLLDYGLLDPLPEWAKDWYHCTK